MRHRVAAPSACVIAYADRHFFKLVLAMLAVFGGLGTFAAIRRWKKLSGHEPEWIAQALASGHGYSFDGEPSGKGQ